MVFFWFIFVFFVACNFNFVCAINYVYKMILPLVELPIPGWTLVQLPAARLAAEPDAGCQGQAGWMDIDLTTRTKGPRT